MNSNTSKTLWAIISCLMLTVLIGCAARKPIENDSVYKHPLFKSMGIENVAILPVIDHRENKELTFDEPDLVLENIERLLQNRGYTASILKNQSLIKSITKEDIAAPLPSWVKSLGPENEQWVLLLILDDLHDEYGLLSVTVFADISGYLYNKETGEKIWEGDGHGEFNSPFITAFVTDDEALHLASVRLAWSFPVKRIKEVGDN